MDKQRISTDFSAAARRYDEHAQIQQLVCADALELAQQQWPPGSLVLDIGCGTGQFAQLAAQSGTGWHVTACDLALGMCAEARAHSPVAQASVTQLPFAAASFHGVFSSLMFQWLENPAPAFAELFRVLRPGGRAIVTSFVAGTLTELSQSFAALDDSPRIHHFQSPLELSTAAVHEGFSLLLGEEEEFIEHHTQLSSLLAHLKAIGATNKHAARKRGLLTPRALKKVESHYRKNFTDEGNLRATWQAMTLLLEKPA